MVHDYHANYCLIFSRQWSESQQIMTLQACYSLSLSLLEIPSGYAADIIGRRKTLILDVY